MDAFKPAEIERMRLGGNQSWREFFEGHDETKMLGVGWDDATIAERYGGVVGEEWKERLSAKVEGKEYIPGEKRTASASPAPSSGAGAGAGTAAPTRSAPRANTLGDDSSSRNASPGPGGGGKVKVDDRYFARLGADNANRPADLPPSQGGKYAGFGSTPTPQSRNDDAALPGLDDLQKDPIAALTKGFGWFTTTVTKTAKTVNNDYIQPTAKQLAESDLAAQARVAAGTVAGTVAKTAQTGARTASEGFHRFVEGPSASGYGRVQGQGQGFDEGKRAFWDDFSSVAEQKKDSSIGTAAMGKGESSRPSQPAKKDDGWDDW